jgi:hypothetical protein
MEGKPRLVRGHDLAESVEKGLLGIAEMAEHLDGAQFFASGRRASVAAS